MPTLLSQLLNPNLLAAGMGAQNNGANTANLGHAQSAPNLDQSTQQTQQQQTPHNLLHANARLGAPTRLQFVVPGEQVDLYG